MYADDTQLLRSFIARCLSDQQAAVSQIQQAVSEIGKWMFNNKLKLNKEKTEFIILVSSSGKRHICIDHLALEGDIVKVSDTVRNLGVTMDSAMTMDLHISNIRKICFYYLTWIRKIRRYLTVDATRSLVRALVMSRIDYCNAVLINLPKGSIARLQAVQNAAARTIMNTPRHAHITPTLKSLHWLPIHRRIEHKVLTYTYKALHGEAPPYLEALVQPYSPQRVLRSQNSNSLVVNGTNNKYGTRAFRNAAPPLWNNLPHHLRFANSLNTFKKDLKTHLFRLEYC